MNNHSAIAELEPPQPLRRPGPQTHFPRPTPSVSINAANSPVSRSSLFIKENWN
ncbi:hypothetical protein MUP38_06455 [Candidatus Bathyarchaeota archaeon]|nr:hypothetical protein [Candidatus Bathyarchaeota archaeon]